MKPAPEWDFLQTGFLVVESPLPVQRKTNKSVTHAFDWIVLDPLSYTEHINIIAKDAVVHLRDVLSMRHSDRHPDVVRALVH